MANEVKEAEDVDMGRIFEIGSLAFARNEPFWDAWWPEHWTEAGRKAGGERFMQIKNTDPVTTYMKATEPSTGKILGFAKWNIYCSHIPRPEPEETGHWPDQEEEKYAKQLAEVFIKKRQAAIERTKGNVVSLDILAVDPAYHRRGVGSSLVQWGVKKADDLGVEAVVESSVFGRGLYEKFGYVFVEDVVLTLPERWSVLCLVCIRIA